MITNERQYRITRAQAERFRQALAQAESGSMTTDDVHPQLIEVQRQALLSQLNDLEDEIAEYEALKGGNLKTISLDSFDELATGLIKARIATGLSQKALADRLGMKEQQIQRYEAERYSSASYQRLKDVARAIGVTIRKEILLPQPDLELSGVLGKLHRAGLSEEFVFSKLLSSPLAAAAQHPDLADTHNVADALSDTVSRVFGWTRNELSSPGALAAPRVASAEARFKMPARRSPETTALYTSYANYLATVVIGGCRDLPRSPLPPNASTLLGMLVERYGSLTLVNALHFTWDLGVPVLPLRDPGAFHGACWRYDGRNVIVLKQVVTHEARWVFDLMHELFHAGQEPESPVREVVEGDETSDDRRHSDEEIAASQFAGDVVLNGRAETLAKLCVAEAGGAVERLKRVVPEVARRERVSTGALANYLAFRLSWQSINWWGTAANLQKEDDDPWSVARDVFIERFPFAIDSDLDRQLLQRALQ